MPVMTPGQMPFLSPNPEDQQNYLDLQYQQHLAQMLLGQGAQQEPNGQMVGPVYVGTAGGNGMAKMLAAYLGNQKMQQANRGMGALQGSYLQNLMQQMGAPGPAQQTPTAQDAQQPSEPQASGNGLVLAGQMQPQGANAQPSPQALAGALQGGQPQGASGGTSSPLNPMGYPPQMAALAYASDPVKYFETLMTQMAPTELQKMLIASGVRPGTPAYQAALQAGVFKATQPAAYRAGSIVPDGRGGMIAMPGAAPAGSINAQQSDGSWAINPIPGGTGAVQAESQAQAAGKTAGTLFPTVDATGAGGLTPGSAYQAPAGPAGGGLQAGRFGGYASSSNAPRTSLPAGSQSIADAGANRIKDTLAQANDSKARVNVIDNILDLSKSGVQTGPTADWTNKAIGLVASIPGASAILPQTIANAKTDVAKFQELSKFINQNALRNWQAAGGTGTDAQLEAQTSANLNKGLFPQALQGVAQWQKASELAVQAKAVAQQQWMDKGGAPIQQSQFESAWRQNFDPRVYQMVVDPMKYASDPAYKDPKTGQLTQMGQQLMSRYMTAKNNGWLQP